MATPMTSSQIVSQLKKWDIKYKEYKNWKNHNRGSRGDGWGPVSGFMVHHTGSDSKDQRELLYAGISGLPGPLCQFGLAQDGTVHLVGWGRANHAGLGDPDVLRAVQNENYGANPPVDNQSSVDGNARFYGVEIWYSGSHAMTDAQYATLRKLASAICDFHKWSEKSVIGHGEWGSPGKWDPGISSGKMMNMAKVRADIKVTLESTTNTPKPPTTPSKPSVPASGIHKVVKNDTLYSLAKRYGMTVEELKKLNKLNSDDLSIGQELKVKKAADAKPSTKPKVPAFPGSKYFRVGANNKHVTALDKALIKAGLAKYSAGKTYTAGPNYTEWTKKNVQAFQKSLGWSGSDADGLVGPETWKRIFLKAGYSA